MNERRKFSPEFKSRVVLELIIGQKGLMQASREYGIKDTVLSRWKQEFLERAPQAFEQPKAADNSGALQLPTSAYEQAKKVAPGLDVYYLETEWRNWLTNKPRPNNPAGSFIGFCRSKYQGKRSP